MTTHRHFAEGKVAESTVPGYLWGPHLFVPGNRPGFISNLLAYRPRSVILDLEYATPLDQKTAGRHLVGRALRHLAEIAPEIRVTVRINAPQAWALVERDLETVVQARPRVLRVPAVEEADELRRLDDRLTECEESYGLAAGDIRLHPMIESPRGLAHAEAIALATPRNEALCLGGEDWAHSCGQIRTPGGDELLYVRSRLVAAAADNGLAAIDTVYTWLDDPEGFAADCERSRGLGFVGRAVTNPRQLAPASAAYKPSDAQRLSAERLLDDLELRDGLGDGPLWVASERIIDPRVVFHARMVTAVPH